MAPRTSSEYYGDSQRHGRNADQAGHAAQEALSRAVQEHFRSLRSGAQGAGQQAVETAQSVGHNVMQNGRELNRELSDVNRSVGQVVDATGRTVGRAADATGQFIGGVANATGRVVSGAVDATGRTVGGVVDATGRFVGGVVDATGRTVNGAVDATGRTIGGVVDATGRTVGGVVDATGRAVGTAVDATGRAYQAGQQRMQDFDRTRPVLSRSLQGSPAHDIVGLSLGGNQDLMHHQTARENIARTARPTEAHPAARDSVNPANRPQEAQVARRAPANSGGDGNHDPRHHRVTSGESYWSIARQQGGTNSQILARANAMRSANHNETLLPGMEIVVG